MAYVLKIIKGKDAGKYVGRKGIRSWDWKPQEDINNARVFASISGIKSFHGQAFKKGDIEKMNSEIKKAIIPYQTQMLMRDWTSVEWKLHDKRKKLHTDITKKYQIPYTDRYEAVEIKLQS